MGLCRERGEAGTQKAGVEEWAEGEVGRGTCKLELTEETGAGPESAECYEDRFALNSVQTESFFESGVKGQSCLRLVLMTNWFVKVRITF